MNKVVYGLSDWIKEIAQALVQVKTPRMDERISFLDSEASVRELIDHINALPEEMPETNNEWYSAHFLAFDLCVAQLQTAIEHHHQRAARQLQFLMQYFAQVIRLEQHTLNFWLPALNAFYDCHVELNEDLQQAYMGLVEQEDEPEEGAGVQSEEAHLNSIKDLLYDMHDLSDFEIAEHLFAQSHAMPSEFFIDLVYDLASLVEGQDVVILFLLHPRAEVRSLVRSVLDKLIPDFTLSSKSLNRLKAIARWGTEETISYYERWIKEQRKKGVLFDFKNKLPAQPRWLATEIDGAGAQGIFVTHRIQRGKYKVAGLLFKRDFGIKDVWLTPLLNQSQAQDYVTDSLDVRVHLRPMQTEDVQCLIQHFIAVTIQRGDVPPIRLLELQENLGLEWISEAIHVDEMIKKLTVQLHPFTEELVQDSIRHSQGWMSTKSLVHSWFEEDLNIDQRVNICCSIVDGVKVCAIEQATEEILTQVLEKNRNHWIFHFLWTSLWAQSKSKPRERFWKDCLLIAHALSQGLPMIEIPIMKSIALQTVMNSLETMHERKAHISVPKP